MIDNINQLWIVFFKFFERVHWIETDGNFWKFGDKIVVRLLFHKRRVTIVLLCIFLDQNEWESAPQCEDDDPWHSSLPMCLWSPDVT